MDLETKCYCHRCLKERDERIGVIPYAMARMVVCPECGDKRCPHAQDHLAACTPPHTVRRPAELDLLRARVAELEKENVTLRDLMAEAMRDFHGKRVLFSSRFMGEATQSRK